MSESTMELKGDRTRALPKNTQAQVVGPVVPQPQALADPSIRTIVRRQREPNGRRFPFPVPNGWFVVGQSRDLLPGDIRSLYAFGRDLVLFRTESGSVHVMDAYCRHLGAHLGAGGKVDGEGIRCPFHGWRYDAGSGRCTDVPYTETDFAPSSAKIRTYRTLERNHMIWAWHHLEDEPPFFEVPEVPEFNDDEWLPYAVKTFEIATCIQEMAENDVDFAHFTYVHGSAPVEDGKLTIEGPYRRTENGDFIRENFGLGLSLLRLGDNFRFMSSVLPLDEENVRLTWWFTAPRSAGEEAAQNIADSFYAGVSQDLAIWENKRYEANPVLMLSEKMIAEQRKWARQFYSGYGD